MCEKSRLSVTCRKEGGELVRADRPVIFYVDNDRNMCDMFAVMCEDFGWAPVFAHRGLEAVEMIEGGLQYAAIVSDLQLLGPLDGGDVLRRSRELNPSIPRVSFSSYAKQLPDATHYADATERRGPGIEAVLSSILRERV